MSLRFGGIDFDGDDDAGSKLDAYIRWVQSILARYEGNMLQLTIGDKGCYLYASFGAPVTHGDDPRRERDGVPWEPVRIAGEPHFLALGTVGFRHGEGEEIRAVRDEGADGDIAKDAVFISPHKFIGGPGTPGLLVVKRRLVTNRVPTVPGGGTVSYVSELDHSYVSDAADREEGGTPAIIESIRAGLVFHLKRSVGEDVAVILGLWTALNNPVLFLVLLAQRYNPNNSIKTAALFLSIRKLGDDAGEDDEADAVADTTLADELADPHEQDGARDAEVDPDVL